MAASAAASSTPSMRRYVERAAAAAESLVSRRAELVAPVIEACRGARGHAAACAPSRLVIIASGSSFNAAQMALPFMRERLGASCPVEVTTPFSYVHFSDAPEPSALALVVTQSGRSTNAIEAIDKLREQCVRAVCVTGDASSPAAAHADVAVDYGVGEELVGYVTKGVTTLVTFLCLLAMGLSGSDEGLAELERALAAAWKATNLAPGFVERHFKQLTSMQVAYICSAGAGMGVSLEGALKIGETVHIPCMVSELEEFIHGPNLQLTPAYTVFMVDPGGSASKRAWRVFEACRAVTDGAYLLTSDESRKDDPCAFVAPRVDPALVSLAYLPFFQMVSAMVSEALGSERQHPLVGRFKEIASAKVRDEQ